MKKTDDFIKYVKRWLISHYSEFTYKPYIVRDLKYKGRLTGALWGEAGSDPNQL